MKNFSLKFIDIMVGIILGLGFQSWSALREPWQFVAFIFVYLDIVDYWIDYAPSLKTFPPKREVNVLLDVSIMFALFLYIYSTQMTIIYFLSVFIVFMLLDYLWLASAKRSYAPTGDAGLFVNTWIRLNLAEALLTTCLIGLVYAIPLSSLAGLAAFIVMRVAVRIFGSLQYRKIHFA